MQTTGTLLAACICVLSSCCSLTLVECASCEDNDDCRMLLKIYYGVSLQDSIMKYQNVRYAILKIDDNLFSSCMHAG